MLQQKTTVMAQLIARAAEIENLESIYKSERSEFVIIYGRRRIGKTFLINQVFEKRFTFKYTGTRGEGQKVQLNRFAKQLQAYSKSKFAPQINSWDEAFELLKTLIDSKKKSERKVIFFDEMPWIDTPKSSFVSALEYFWNSWASTRSDIMFIACGSATSWMVNKLLRNRGGLYNRITAQIYLRPFNLGESEEYLQSIGCDWDRYTVLQCYMALGGVPFYMSLLKSKLSFAQNIDALFFGKNAVLSQEFDELFTALFVQADNYIEVVKALSQRREGMLRSEIIEKTKISGGGLSKILDNLERCDFIMSFSKYKSAVRNTVYRLSDSFTLFYFKFANIRRGKDSEYWSKNQASSTVKSWLGFSFENVCLLHIDQIKNKLGISGIPTTCSTWRKTGDDDSQGAQIDLLIERSDRVINVCEIKFSELKYSISKEYADNLRNKMSVFADDTSTNKTLNLVMVTTYGITQGKNSGIVNNEVVMDDLFKVL